MGAGGIAAAAFFAVALVLAGTPARSEAEAGGGATGAAVANVTVSAHLGVARDRPADGQAHRARRRRGWRGGGRLRSKT